MPTLLIALLIGLMMYRRTKRTIGAQKLVRSRLWFRTIVFGIIGCMFLYASFLHPVNFIADFVGLACGLVLAFYAVKHTEFEKRTDGWYYRTSLWVNIAVMALFIGRIAYKLLYHGAMNAPAPAPVNPIEMYGSDPLTIGIFFVLVAYYIRFFTFLLFKHKELNRTDSSALS
ncbi:CcdC protein domain-containing protein [Paenibacillus sp. H1-7]|uniref:CcdC protein domain-containing protein n=1 Tax=Paenibacillus sp. H1-7 TaxID=2282849 RepID=UPI001EF83DA3|nr:CcdC protein domain-containing protein [Paenibacillus sp. H1-7]